jgi:hypothetical protein
VRSRRVITSGSMAPRTVRLVILEGEDLVDKTGKAGVGLMQFCAHLREGAPEEWQKILYFM